MTKLNPEDIAFIHEQMKNVKPIKPDHKVQLRPKPPAPRLRKATPSETAQEFPFMDHMTETVTMDSKLFFARVGLPEKTLKSLRKGEIRHTMTLDLHGTTVEQARSLLSHFLADAVQEDQRCVLLIHGRGKYEITPPVLKNYINTWLRQYPDVLAFCSAVPHDGGTGAVYVWLKRRRES